MYAVSLQHLVRDFFCKTQAAEYYLVNRKRLFQFSLLTGGHPRTDSFWNQDSFLGLIIFQDAAYNSSGCAHGGVKHVTVCNLQKMEHTFSLFIWVILSINIAKLNTKRNETVQQILISKSFDQHQQLIILISVILGIHVKCIDPWQENSWHHSIKWRTF